MWPLNYTLKSPDENKWAVTLENQQPGRAHSDHSLRCLYEESIGPKLPTEYTVKTDQTGQMPRLIWVCWLHTHFVGFVMSWLYYASKSAGKSIKGLEKYLNFTYKRKFLHF